MGFEMSHSVGAAGGGVSLQRRVRRAHSVAHYSRAVCAFLCRYSVARLQPTRRTAFSAILPEF
ncbi:hypothetical protein ACFPRL_03885 [Pseudoclavibacter helvolus]